MRYAPGLDLPPYTYIPGRRLHPISDPAGHRFGDQRPQSFVLDPVHWRDCDGYCFAVDLFNHGFYWESHEVWEGCWNAAGRRGPVADFLKGLIKLAAALVKALEGRPEGARRHAERADALFRSVAADVDPHADSFAGLRWVDLERLARTLRARAAKLSDVAATLETSAPPGIAARAVRPLIAERLELADSIDDTAN